MKRVPYLLLGMLLLTVGAAWADEPITNWLQHPVTPLAEDVRTNFWTTMALTTPFLLLPQILLIIVIIRFRASRGHAPATWHENVKLEILWTTIPVLTLIAIAIPAYATLKRMDVPPKSDLVVEVIGHQFFWEYRYPKYNVGISNEPLVVPAGKVVTVNTTSVDVIHSWWVPAFGIKQDANPGRITHTWFKAREGKYKGQCAELCGSLHAQMWIDVKVVPPEEFEEWVQARVPEEEPPVQAAPDTTGGKSQTMPADSVKKPVAGESVAMRMLP